MLSSDNLLGSLGGALAQPGLGRVADVWSYATSYLVTAGVEALAWPFLLLARRERAPSDPIPRGAEVERTVPPLAEGPVSGTPAKS